MKKKSLHIWLSIFYRFCKEFRPTVVVRVVLIVHHTLLPGMLRFFFLDPLRGIHLLDWRQRPPHCVMTKIRRCTLLHSLRHNAIITGSRTYNRTGFENNPHPHGEPISARLRSILTPSLSSHAKWIYYTLRVTSCKGSLVALPAGGVDLSPRKPHFAPCCKCPSSTI